MIDQAAAVEHFRGRRHWRRVVRLHGRVLAVPTLRDVREVFDPVLQSGEDGEEWTTDVFDDSQIDLQQRDEFLNACDHMSYRNLNDAKMPDDYLALFPFRVYGYSMLNRRWFSLYVDLVKDTTVDGKGSMRATYDDLIFPPGHKRFLQALIADQVREPAQNGITEQIDKGSFSMDVVREKEKGLVILLHGPPGVGKRSTAETMAAQLKRPLLPFSCGDIGITVSEAENRLENRLENYCALAYRWRAVLLLDDADTFLVKREKGDLLRSALVSGLSPYMI